MTAVEPIPANEFRLQRRAIRWRTFAGIGRDYTRSDGARSGAACGLERRCLRSRDGYSSNLAVKPIPRVRRMGGFISSRIADMIAAIALSCIEFFLSNRVSSPAKRRASC